MYWTCVKKYNIHTVFILTTNKSLIKPLARLTSSLSPGSRAPTISITEQMKQVAIDALLSKIKVLHKLNYCKSVYYEYNIR